MSGKIIGIPPSEWDYEFMVVIPTDDGNYMWHSNFENADPAYELAKKLDGVVAHNVRIAHKEIHRKNEYEVNS